MSGYACAPGHAGVHLIGIKDASPARILLAGEVEEVGYIVAIFAIFAIFAIEVIVAIYFLVNCSLLAVRGL